MRLLAIGDIAWDVMVRPSGELVWGSDVYGSTDLLPGGSSANVAVWARRLGAEADLVGKVGDDRLGDLMRAHLAGEGLARGVTVERGHATTRITIIVRGDGEHAFVTDHSNPLRLTSDDLPVTLLDGTDAVFLNGYAVFMAGTAAFAGPLLESARRRRCPIAFDPSSFPLVARYGPGRLLDELGALDVLLGNEEELETLSDGRGAPSLLQHARLVVVKQGARGATALLAGKTVRAAAVPVQVVETTGAGDAFDAAFLVEYFTHGELERALTAANVVGGRVTASLGAQP